MTEKLKIVFDIDNTISVWNDDRDYANFKPIHSMIETINHLYDEGHTIILNTARGMSFYNEDMELIEKHNRPIIEKWLKDNGVKYHKLYMGKPLGDYYVDDKNISILKFLAKYAPTKRKNFIKQNNKV